MFRSPRFLNGVLARWVLTGGLSNLSNRADIGLTAERLATLGAAHGARGKAASASNGVGVGGVGKGKSRGSGHTRASGGDGRWEETTSNATTVVSAGGRGGRLRLGGLAGGSVWSGAASARPASSTTSRSSRPTLVRRPLGRSAVASTAGRSGGGGTQWPSDGRTAGGNYNARRAGKVLGPSGSSGSVGKRRGGGEARVEKWTEVPRLQLRRVESGVVVGPSLLTLRPPVLSARRIGRGNNGSNNSGNLDRSGVAVRLRRASSALSYRPSTGRSSSGSRSCGGDGGIVAVESTSFDVGGVVADDRREPKVSSGSSSLSAAVQSWRTPRSRSPPLQQEHEHEIVAFGTDDASIPAHSDLGPCVSDTATLSQRNEAAADNGVCYPRPPCRAARHAVEGGGRNTDPIPAFAAALLPSCCARPTPTEGVAASHAVSGASFRSRATSESCRGGVSNGTISTRSTAAPPGLLVDSRALKGTVIDVSTAVASRGAPPAREPRRIAATAAAPKDRLFPAATARGNSRIATGSTPQHKQDQRREENDATIPTPGAQRLLEGRRTNGLSPAAGVRASQCRRDELMVSRLGSKHRGEVPPLGKHNASD